MPEILEESRGSGEANFRVPSGLRPLYCVLVLFSLIPILVLPTVTTNTGLALLTAWIGLLWISMIFVRGQFHNVAIIWVAVYPYCYYFFSFYVKRSIFTVDRAFILLLVIEMFIVSRQSVVAPLTSDIRASGYFWGIYLLVCLVPLAGHAPSAVVPSYRMLLEGMLMPPLLGLYAMRYFPLLKSLQKLHLAACVLGLGLGISGLIELITDTDLFPYGSEPLYTDTHILRADGPFEQQIVLSMVAMLAFFFIVYLWRLMPGSPSRGRALLHKAGWVSSFGAALLPLNRGLIIALVPIALIDCCSRDRLVSRRTWAAFFAVVVLAVGAAKLKDPRLYDDRVAGPNNFYQRLAQQQETLRIVRGHPFFGVGFGLYYDVASQDPRYLTSWMGIESMNIPHNVIMTVLSEEGIVGLLFYVLAQVFLIRAMWKIRRAYPPGWLAFLYCILVYVLIGLDFATVAFSDINLFYIFVLGILYQLQIRIACSAEFADSSSTDHLPTHVPLPAWKRTAHG
jgi:hypothetical protein